MNNRSHAKAYESNRTCTITTDEVCGQCSVLFNMGIQHPDEYVLDLRFDEIWYALYPQPPRLSLFARLEWCACELLRRYINVIDSDVFCCTIPSLDELLFSYGQPSYSLANR